MLAIPHVMLVALRMWWEWGKVGHKFVSSELVTVGFYVLFLQSNTENKDGNFIQSNQTRGMDVIHSTINVE